MHHIEIALDVPVPMRDGTVLRADVYRPAGDGTYPVVVSRGPYDKNAWADSLMDIKTMVRSGYVVVCQDTRGRFASEGEWMPWKHERQDGYDTVEWAASLPYSSGKVGTFGLSYLGSTQWSAAISGAPHLRTIVPTMTWSDPEDGLMFRGGAVELGLNTGWSLAMALGQYEKAGLSPDEAMAKTMTTLGDFDSLATRTYWQLPSGAQPAIVASGQPDIGVARALADQATLDESRVVGRYDEIDLPTLHFAGWYDVFLQGSLDNYFGMRSRGRTARLIVGPWWHDSMIVPTTGGQVGSVNFGVGAQLPGGLTYTEIHRGWYDHWLKDLPATEEHESGVLLFVMGASEWRVEPEWPLSRARDTPLYLHKASSLSWDAPEVGAAETPFTYDPADPVPTNGGNLVMATDYPAGPFDQRDQEVPTTCLCSRRRHSMPTSKSPAASVRPSSRRPMARLPTGLCGCAKSTLRAYLATSSTGSRGCTPRPFALKRSRSTCGRRPSSSGPAIACACTSHPATSLGGTATSTQENLSRKGRRCEWLSSGSSTTASVPRALPCPSSPTKGGRGGSCVRSLGSRGGGVRPAARQHHVERIGHGRPCLRRGAISDWKKYD